LKKDCAPHINRSAEVEAMPVFGDGFSSACCRIASRHVSGAQESDAIVLKSTARQPRSEPFRRRTSVMQAPCNILQNSRRFTPENALSL
jgi:hypothetical protein